MENNKKNITAKEIPDSINPEGMNELIQEKLLIDAMKAVDVDELNVILEKIKRESLKELKENESRALGIPSSGYDYQKILKGQSPIEEMNITRQFFYDTFSNSKEPELANSKKKLQFINYGDTELVFVLTVGENKRYAVLIGQPATTFGIVKQEFNNLQFLASENPKDIVRPMYYFSNPDIQREFYIAPYLMQARCIASQKCGWGVYVPEPFYHFKTFTERERTIVNSSIIAQLIKLYNQEKKLGIAECKIGGGDFVLEKEWDNEELTYENTLNRMKLIAARELMPIELENYIELIRKEFSQCTYYSSEEDRDTSILINYKSRIPMTEEEIETGIELGLKLRERKRNERNKTI